MFPEDQIKNNRRDYDDIERVPREEIWTSIRQKRRKNSSRRINIARYLVAASVAGLLTIPFLLIKSNNTTNTDSALLSANYPEFIDQERKYYQLANDKKRELSFDNLNKETYADLLKELRQIDTLYADLKSDIGRIPDAEKAIQTAIKFHERRLHILELLEREIQNQNRFEENENNIKI